MKQRLGWVPNSSSMNFYVVDKSKFDEARKFIDSLHHWYDYLEYKGKLYTSMFHGDSDDILEIYKLPYFIRGEVGHSDGPYGKDDGLFVDLEGEKGIDDIWIPKEEFTVNDYIKYGKIPPLLANALYHYVDSYNKENMTIEDYKEFYDKCKAILLTTEEDYEDED